VRVFLSRNQVGHGWQVTEQTTLTDQGGAALQSATGDDDETLFGLDDVELLLGGAGLLLLLLVVFGVFACWHEHKSLKRSDGGSQGPVGPAAAGYGGIPLPAPPPTYTATKSISAGGKTGTDGGRRGTMRQMKTASAAGTAPASPAEFARQNRQQVAAAPFDDRSGPLSSTPPPVVRTSTGQEACSTRCATCWHVTDLCMCRDGCWAGGVAYAFQ
jgi:hypothetical protein